MTTDGTLDERYLTWLHRKLEPDTQRNPARSHWLLCVQLYKKEFTWFIPNDDNRLYDGLDLRQEFIDEEEGGDAPGIWLSEPCSFLEMLVALSRRMAFDSNLEPDYWFWRMLENMNIRMYVDELYDDEVHILIDSLIDGVIQRKFKADGSEGLFPLRHPGHDQREVEIWYQMSQYLIENISV
jgi:hypothetical protein